MLAPLADSKMKNLIFHIRIIRDTAHKDGLSTTSSPTIKSNTHELGNQQQLQEEPNFCICSVLEKNVHHNTPPNLDSLQVAIISACYALHAFHRQELPICLRAIFKKASNK
ncbi:unnamed protein product [Lepeophtheirus salmonis]|uniref:(salmon louse) hypothetical protein n=1 Tax=Lepeophtheirus salmonis TaxID=72036 RepID=A0A7R8CYM8_LEPSM|nr:unnamed protein product [Lepeophtheirus salmonis]CAF2970636.1 unnamed protein product [Lepeophtheirus salmonis]